MKHKVRTTATTATTTTTTTTSHVAPCVTFIFWCRVTFAMMASGQPSGAAQRRRQRRLRSWWRHEQQSIAAALAAATHHSAQQNGALRSLKTATRAREEAGSETYNAPRGPKTLPPGVRPAPLAEVAGPQVMAATGGYVAARASLLAVSSLRGADGVGRHRGQVLPPG